MLESDETFQFHILITLTSQASIVYEVHFLRQGYTPSISLFIILIITFVLHIYEMAEINDMS